MKKLLTFTAVFGMMFMAAANANEGKKWAEMTPEQKAEMKQKKMEKCMEKGKSSEECKKVMMNKKEKGCPDAAKNDKDECPKKARMTEEERAAWREKKASMTDQERAAWQEKRAAKSGEARKENRAAKNNLKSGKKPTKKDTAEKPWYKFW
ncbi:MAG: hypothetical protein FWG39_01505 [Alphaproteobacteria bacterium]|nr:hypothetical protein [Alphaproteobacteria bacterium]